MRLSRPGGWQEPRQLEEVAGNIQETGCSSIYIWLLPTAINRSISTFARTSQSNTLAAYQNPPLLPDLSHHCTILHHSRQNHKPPATNNMYRSILIASIASLVASQSTVDAVSQVGDGQIQAPTEQVSEPAPSVPTSAPYSNPFTIYLTETDSWGVITGMPAVATSQPEVVTSQPTQPAVVTSQPVSPTHTYESSTTLQTSTTSSEVTSESEQATSTTAASSSPSVAPLNGGAETKRVAGAGLALVVVSIGFFML